MLIEMLKKVMSTSSIPHIWKWSKKEHKYVFITALLNVLIAGLSLAFSLRSKAIVDSAVLGDSGSIIKNAVIIAAILLVQIVSYYSISRLNLYVKARMQMNMRSQMLDQILKKEYKTISTYHSGELVNRMFSDVNTVIDGVTSIIPPLLCMLTQLIGAVIILARLDYRFVIVLCASGVITLVLTFLFKSKMKIMHKDVQQKEGKVHAILQETLENTKLIKASGSEDHVQDMVSVKQKDYYSAQIDRNRFTSVAASGLRSLFNFTWLFAMAWGCFGIASGAYTYGTLMAIIQLVGQIQSPFRNLSSTMQQIYGTISSAERIMEIYDLQDEDMEEGDNYDPEKLYSDLERIKISDLDFSYDRKNPVLRDVDISLNKGEIVAFTGLSGGGKSTLFLLMLGIYKPVSGRISLIGKNIDIDVSRKTRGLFAYVPQGNTLFSGTLRENLIMFNDKARDEEIYKAMEIACIRDFVDNELEDGLETVIGERGIGLSEGQAQRLAIARAIISNAPVLLLDEATSALDEMTEASLLKNIQSLNNKTCFIVTHRKAAFGICSRRVHIENQRVFGDLSLE